ncbi:preprotein translocase subunit SecY [Caminibacter mediatlanticus TB-2]|uniref:Protein translocase subunit SecY n=1 Tax=Caminibacter mediatlanticus TB-2 TaxID=391592 RepID=A0ABX5VAW9_9BACT|nr:preprotein translocase subunit SecY [Caminibacter mediatlanticus]QCT93999.1 preprotein translocase subunit SecY [Caminibacter mediatlanticus TB-2]
MNNIAKKILITLGFLLIYRILAYVPVPGVNLEVIKEFFAGHQNDALGLLNMFSGNAVSRMSIIALGVMPYITASIIMELLAATFPKLGELKKDSQGFQKYMKIIKYATVAIAFIQAIGIAMGLTSMTGKMGESAVMIDTTTFVILAAFSMLGGTMLLVWIGEQISERGIGNGISLIIFAGIVSAIPSAIVGILNLVDIGELSVIGLLVVLVIVIATILFIIYVELAERRIPVSYQKKVLMQNRMKRVMNYIPIKLNLSGVIPPIFASAILMFPLTILSGVNNPILVQIRDLLSPNGYLFHIIQFILVIFFAYFYASIVFNAKEIAENLKKQGGFIPGIRPGEQTAKFLNEVASRLTFWGALYLGLITVLPWLLVKLIGINFYFGGTAVLIVVQVAIDTMRRIQAQITMQKYDTLSVTGL